ncbi:MAG TPA: bifunctional phosphoribosyl-AMP cyclohydrolase/phosphoribosyl-ATP diphosphatase HisIE [Bacteroidia bacterium]|jgi:phosphoribosyl-ATP pyrophosphohydrolase/phosphoribosyl-AMP cyclohydrolase
MKPDFTKSVDGLIPVIVQDDNTQKILMLAYMNEEAFEKTKKEGKATFYSRSRSRLWTKGEESGNFLNVVEMRLDCDDDTLLIKARPQGPVCHTGADTCFNESNRPGFLTELECIIAQRKSRPAEESYVSSLFASGINKIAQKVGEEAIELVIEAKDNDPELFKNEAADLLFHYLILLNAKGFSLGSITAVLEERNVKQK